MSISGGRLLVAGIGSYFSSDDEIGLALVNALAESSHPEVETVLWEDADALTLAHELLSLTTPALLVDCADMRLPAGSWKCFRAENARLNSTVKALCTHGLGVAEALEIAQELGCAQTIYFFGIQPFDLSPQPGLSKPMQQHFPVLLDALTSTVDGVTA